MRPVKKGLDYFPLDVDIDSDDKVYLLQAKMGLEGFAILIKVLCKIFREGYYANFSEQNKCIFAAKIGIDKNKIEQFLQVCFEADIFDKSLYDKYEIITSRGIQKRYIEACRRRKVIDIKPEYSLLDEKKSNQTQPQEMSFYQRLVNALSNCQKIKIENRVLAVVAPVWEKLFKDVDIEREIMKAENWLIVKNKTKKRYDRFLSNWFNKSIQYKKSPSILQSNDPNKYDNIEE